MAKILIITFIIFSAYSILFPWEHEYIGIYERDGLRVDIDVRPQILIGIQRDWKELAISIPFCDIWIYWGKHVTKGGPRG